MRGEHSLDLGRHPFSAGHAALRTPSLSVAHPPPPPPPAPSPAVHISAQAAGPSAGVQPKLPVCFDRGRPAGAVLPHSGRQRHDPAHAAAAKGQPSGDRWPPAPPAHAIPHIPAQLAAGSVRRGTAQPRAGPARRLQAVKACGPLPAPRQTPSSWALPGPYRPGCTGRACSRAGRSHPADASSGCSRSVVTKVRLRLPSPLAGPSSLMWR